jgi:preprotein translocase subunit SecE
MSNRLTTFLQDSRQELKRVNWPTRKETAKYTLFVIAFSIIIAVFLGILDFGFMQIIENLII